MPGDLDRLVEIENACFQGDRLSRRSLVRLMRPGSAGMLVLEQRGVLAGYAAVLFHALRTSARLYSIAIDAEFAGKGLGGLLLAAAEEMARGRGAQGLRLEVRQDNDAAQRLYRRAGYRHTGTKPAYYSDGMAALVFEKSLG
jgi:ribosomal-protein-alanine acetyltransferase